LADFDAFARPEFLTLTERSKKLARLQSVYTGHQYDGRPNWWTGRHGDSGEPVPIRKRKPCTIYRLPQAATNQVVRFLYGDGRFPHIEVERPDDADEGGVALSEDDAEALEEWFGDLIEHARLKPVERSRAKRGVAIGTAVTVIDLVDGRFSFAHPLPEHCYAEFRNGDPNDDVLRLVWCFPFEKEVVGKDGKPSVETWFFRREWDKQSVYIYADAKLEHPTRLEDVTWAAPSVAPHGLSFCPVLWTRNQSDEGTGVDGCSLFDGSEEEIEALDMTLSRRHQGLIYLGAPQPYETGVRDDDGPEAVASGPAGYSKGLAGTAPHGDVTPRIRRVGPESMWTYRGKDVTVGLLETSGKAFEVATLHVNDIRSRLLEQWGVVLTSMSDTVAKVTTGAEMSARFLALAHAPLIGLVQEYRHNWWSFSLEKLLTMCLRITVEKKQQNQYVLIPNSDRIATICASMLSVQVGQDESGVPVFAWSPPRLTPRWGAFFEPSALETKERTDAAAAAKTGQLISGKSATQYVAHDFDVEDVDAELTDIDGERQADADRETDRELAAIAELDRRAQAGGGVGISRGGGAGAAQNQAGTSGRGGGSSSSATSSGQTSS
jgi:hypothetical protein